MPLRFLFLEPHFSGSHKAFAEGLKAHSRHDIDLLTLPGVNWKWRMRSSALHYAGVLCDLKGVDGLIVSNMVDLARLKGLVTDCPPTLVYMHESQLTYPPPKGSTVEVDLVMQEIFTVCAADRVVFNSSHHRELFINSLSPFLSRFPDVLPEGLEEAVAEKSRVIYPGCSLPKALPAVEEKQTAPPLIIWNHRWSYDKNFPAMLHVLEKVAAEGVPFQVALLGESAGGKAEAPFHQALKTLGDRVVHFGYCETAEVYRSWLTRGAIVVSSAVQENFGISVVEAMAYGCLPLLPSRLAYPEVLPEAFHGDHLYTSRQDAISKLCALLRGCAEQGTSVSALARHMMPHDWEHRIKTCDETLSSLIPPS
ncbi:tRNA-queuosine alpha-mannosyltransferase domain-containing protein [Desulfoluna spongiiphila]|uniref:tRNA-queuosine alpha-mannosyltransferase n=1 Tax=Desulfoluna spongiiphila TaxID=419481 RepID=A0A1G5D9S3_9BACT|nr:DUF3524 domain-containing protein [Desulfoluna spongiiphila]SCY11366.1 Glycosyl transferases group 1 [Desulfoluna spongiiphila]